MEQRSRVNIGREPEKAKDREKAKKDASGGTLLPVPRTNDKKTRTIL